MHCLAQHCRCISSHARTRLSAHQQARPAYKLPPSCAYSAHSSTGVQTSSPPSTATFSGSSTTSSFSNSLSSGFRHVLVHSTSSSPGSSLGSSSSSNASTRVHSKHSSPSQSQTSLDADHPYPSWDEEKDVSHVAFMNAFGASRPAPARVPGLQEFAAALWERRRRIPSQLYHDPLDHIFTEFDIEGTGSLTAQGIARALESYDVTVSPEAVQAFITATDANCNGTIEREEFSAFVYHVASADLRAGAGVCCSISPPASADSSPASSASEATVDP